MVDIGMLMVMFGDVDAGSFQRFWTKVDTLHVSSRHERGFVL